MRENKIRTRKKNDSAVDDNFLLNDTHMGRRWRLNGKREVGLIF